MRKQGMALSPPDKKSPASTNITEIDGNLSANA